MLTLDTVQVGAIVTGILGAIGFLFREYARVQEARLKDKDQVNADLKAMLTAALAAGNRAAGAAETVARKVAD